MASQTREGVGVAVQCVRHLLAATHAGAFMLVKGKGGKVASSTAAVLGWAAGGARGVGEAGRPGCYCSCVKGVGDCRGLRH